LDSLTAVDNLLDDEQMLKYFSPHAVPKLIGTRRTLHSRTLAIVATSDTKGSKAGT